MPLDELRLSWPILAFLVVASIVVGIAFARWWRGVQSRGRNRVAARGERTAETILERAGFRIVARQAMATWSMAIDGVEVEVDVRADLLVRRRGRTYVAEVKTGELAPDPRHPPTRRQLLEYSLAFGADEVLLVDVPAETIKAIAFPRL